MLGWRHGRKMEMRRVKKLAQESDETPLRSIVLDVLWIALPCLAISVVSGVLEWHVAARLFGWAGFSVLGWNAGRMVRVMFKQHRARANRP